MSEGVRYQEYHPRWYRPRISTFWWLHRRSYLVFVVRELSSVFVAWFVAFLLLLANAVAQGDAEYRRFLDWSASPWVIVLNVVALAFVVFHTITWLNLAPRAMVVRLRGKQVPPVLVAALNYVAWAVLSALVVWLTLG